MGEPDTSVRTSERATEGRKDLRYPAAPEPLSVPAYDNHCHLEIVDGDSSLTLAEQLDRAQAVGILGVVQASGDVESSRWAVAAAESDPRVLAAVAIHPNDAPTYADAGRLEEALAVIDELAARPRTRAIGETGLDYFRTEERGAPRSTRRSRRTSPSRRSTASRCRSTTATRTTTCSRRSAAWALPSARCSTASPAMRRWRGYAPTPASTSRSPETSPSRTRRTCATRWR